jgi:transcriptional regulator with XRE-family HTH domain
VQNESQPKPVAQALANNLRRWRQERGLSLSAAARRAEVSKATLSELERARGNPSIDTLWALARALNVPFAVLFHEDAEADAAQVLRREDAPIVTSDPPNFEMRHLLSRHHDCQFEIYEADLHALMRREAQGHSPGVVEHSIVLEGELEIVVPPETITLRAGDIATFRADRYHHYEVKVAPVRLLIVAEYPGRLDPLSGSAPARRDSRTDGDV